MRRLLSSRASRTSLLAAAASAALIVGTIAVASAGGIVGDPQPELEQFTVAATGSSGSGVVMPDGNLVLAAPVNDKTIKVCVLHPGERACFSSAMLHAYTGGGGDSFTGASVVATGGTHVSVVTEDCCYLPVGGGNGGMVVFDSVNDGRTFGSEIPAGTLQGVGTAVYDNGQIVVGDGENSGSTEIQSFAVDPSSASTSIATLGSYADTYDTSLAKYGSGVLVASDDSTSTHVEFDRSGTSFNDPSSWTSIATIAGSDTTAISGQALLTDPGGSLTGGEQLRFFNGTSFGAAHKVPDSKAGDDGYFAMQEAGGTVHVFFEGRRDGYDLITETTGNGVSWSPQVLYGSAIDEEDLAPVLGRIGSGLVFEADGTPMRAQPILDRQGVQLVLAAARVKVGRSTIARGRTDPAIRFPHAGGLIVTLQELRAGKWYPVRTTRESSAGTFSFRLAAGHTTAYRAVVDDDPGYYQYGYSNAVTLVAVS